MRLDVIIPTYNRAALLTRTLESLLAAELPDDLDVRVTVVDNGSTDATPATVRSYMNRFAGRLRYVFQPKPGRSHALNAGIAATDGDLVAMIDDDEEVDRTWLRVIHEAFSESSTDFIGGPYAPRWVTPRPPWLPMRYRAVIGWVDGGDEVRAYGPGFDGMLMGGNAVIRRSVLRPLGPYAVHLGRTAGRLLSCEDEDMFRRLLAAGARGFYRPDLIIHHYIAPERLTKRYFRQWCFWWGVSLGLLSRDQPSPAVHVLGVPRYMVGAALRAAADTVARLLRGDAAQRFANELLWWDLAGFVYGRHFYRPDAIAAGETGGRVQEVVNPRGTQ